jgi:hypothetical protein
MALREDIPALLKAFDDHKDVLKNNADLFDIFEGNLLPHVQEAMRNQLSQQAYEEACKRTAPINVLIRLIDKLSKIYEKPPLRDFIGASDTEKTEIANMLETMEYDTTMGGTNGANGMFNLFKNTWIEPYLEDGEPKLRVIPSDRFFVVSKDRVNPTKPTHLVKIMGKVTVAEGDTRILFFAYTADEFIAFDDKKDIRTEIMLEYGLEDGKNPLGALPGVYINRSKYLLMPKPDTDTRAMTILIPVLLTDLNYALMYQVFSILYTIDVDQSNLKSGPNALWDLKSQAGMGEHAKPSVGVVKPEVDSDKALDLIRALFSLWMETRNIKAGAGGQVTTDNAASAISKIVDEMDTSGDRNAQIPYFKMAEQKLLTLVLTKYHELWKNDPEYKFRTISISPTITPKVTFSEQRPMVDPSVAIDDQVKKLDAGLQTKEGALRELYPDWTDEQIQKKLSELDTEQAKRDAADAAAAAKAGASGNANPAQNGAQNPADMNYPAGGAQIDPQTKGKS